jgi:hypothetical protein
MTRAATAMAMAMALCVALVLLATPAARGAATSPDEAFELVRGPAPAVRAGQSAAVSLSIVPRSGYRLLDGGPVLVLVRGEHARPRHALYKRDDAIDPRADVPRFELAFTAERAGAARLEAACTFYVCKAARCRPIETTLTWELTIAP